MGNKEIKELSHVITYCHLCKVPFDTWIEISTSATRNKKVYTIHQHGENIVVSKFHNTITCKYKADIINKQYQFISSSKPGLTDKALITMTRKVFISENIMKFLFTQENSFAYNIPLDVVKIIVKMWYNYI